MKKSVIKYIAILLVLFATTLYSSPTYAQKEDSGKEYQYVEALKMLNLGQLESAEKLLRQLITNYPDMDAAYYYLAAINLKKGRLEDAKEETQKAYRLDTTNYWYAVQLARLFSASGETDRSLKIYESLKRQYPSRPDLYIEIIELYSKESNFKDALKTLGEYEEVGGKNEATVLTRYNILISLGRPAEAIESVMQFDSVSPTPGTSTLLGDYNASMKNDTTAIKHYLLAVELDPTYIPAIFGLAESYRMRGQFDLYFKHIQQFLINDNVNPAMKANYIDEIIGNQKFVQTFLPQVDTMMSGLYGAHQSDSLISYKYALYLVQTSRDQRAYEVLKNSVEAHPGEYGPLHQYLSLQYYMENWEDLVSTSENALNLFPRDKEFLQMKGIGQLQLNKITAAIETFLKIVPLAKNDTSTLVRVYAILGDTYYMADNRRESYKYYKRCISLDPNHAPALNNYAYYLSEENRQLKKALEMSKHTIELEPENYTYLDTYAWILHKLGRNSEAKSYLKQAIIFGGNDNIDILNHYADILNALGEKDLAFIYRERAEKLK